ncbi:MAG TPA: hypothetical protein VKY90_16800 [Candidatus Dormibacteraeota bacterium]|nr:hypothetical protein [Candidatus Dormibacteraeota bacterium]
MSVDWVEAVEGPIQPLAYHDLERRPGFKLALHVAGGRWYLYVSHLWHSGWSIVDVTDPELPRLVRFVAGPPNTWTLQVTIRAPLMATSLEPVPAHWGGDPSKPYEEGVLIWDLDDPEDPRLRGHFRTGHRGTHRNGFDSTGLLHLSARMPGYEGLILVTLDVSDPEHPCEVGRFHLPGQHVAGGERSDQPTFGLHGPLMRVGDLGYLPYGTSGLVILDLSDPSQPALRGRLPMHPPLGSDLACHTVVPLPRRGLAVVNSEALAEDCDEAVGFAGTVDVADPANPKLIGLFPTPRPTADMPYRSFCEKGGRFGPHNQSMPGDDPHLFSSDQICFLTYFNAGLRVYDLSHPRQVTEVAFLIPKDPTRRIGMLPRRLVVQVEDVLVDARGIMYFTEKNSGLYLAHWRGSA